MALWKGITTANRKLDFGCPITSYAAVVACGRHDKESEKLTVRERADCVTASLYWLPRQVVFIDNLLYLRYRRTCVQQAQELHTASTYPTSATHLARRLLRRNLHLAVKDCQVPVCSLTPGCHMVHQIWSALISNDPLHAPRSSTFCTPPSPL